MEIKKDFQEAKRNRLKKSVYFRIRRREISKKSYYKHQEYEQQRKKLYMRERRKQIRELEQEHGPDSES